MCFELQILHTPAGLIYKMIERKKIHKLGRYW